MPEGARPTPEYKVAKEAVENADTNKDSIIDAKEKQSIQKSIDQLQTIMNGDNTLKLKSLGKAFRQVLSGYKGVSRKEVAQWILGSKYNQLAHLKHPSLKLSDNDDSDEEDDIPSINSNHKDMQWVGPPEEDETIEVPVAPFVDPDYVELSDTADSFSVNVDCGEDVDEIRVYRFSDIKGGSDILVETFLTNGEDELSIVIPHIPGQSDDYIIKSVNSAGESEEGADVAVDIEEEDVEEINEVPTIDNFEVSENPCSSYDSTTISFDLNDLNEDGLTWELTLEDGLDGYLESEHGTCNEDGTHCSGTVTGSGSIEVTFNTGDTTNAIVSLQVSDGNGGVVDMDPYIIGVQ